MDKKLSKLPACERRFYENQRIEDIFGAFNLIAGDQNTVQEKPQSVNDWKRYTTWNKIVKPSKLFRERKHKIYIQPIGPFPNILNETNIFVSMLETLKVFIEAFFPCLQVVPMETVDYKSISCKTRFHSKSKQKQLLVSDVQLYLKTVIPKDAICLCGLSWFDLYPSEELNHILGEASYSFSTVVASFGHYAYFREKEARHLEKWGNDYVVEQSVSVAVSTSQESLVFVTSSERCEADMRSPNHEIVCQRKRKNSESFKTSPLENTLSTDSQDHRNSTETLKDCSLEALPNGYAFYLNCKIFRRLFRVMTHEICHVMGMSHCCYYSCTMNMSSSILHVDKQPLLLCPICLRKLQLVLKFEVRARYISLFTVLTNHMQQFCRHKEDDVCPFMEDTILIQNVLDFMADP